MTDDLVDRLRNLPVLYDAYPGVKPRFVLLESERDEFITEIERLRKEVQLCRNVLPAHIAKALYQGEG